VWVAQVPGSARLTRAAWAPEQRAGRSHGSLPPLPGPPLTLPPSPCQLTPKPPQSLGYRHWAGADPASPQQTLIFCICNNTKIQTKPQK